MESFPSKVKLKLGPTCSEWKWMFCKLGYKNLSKNPTYEIAEKKHDHVFPNTQRMREK